MHLSETELQYEVRTSTSTAGRGVGIAVMRFPGEKAAHSLPNPCPSFRGFAGGCWFWWMERALEELVKTADGLRGWKEMQEGNLLPNTNLHFKGSRAIRVPQ